MIVNLCDGKKVQSEMIASSHILIDYAICIMHCIIILQWTIVFELSIYPSVEEER